MKSITRLILVVFLIFSFVVAEISAKNEPVQLGRKESSHESHQAKDLTADWDYKLRLDSKHFALFTTSPASVAESIPKFAENVYESFFDNSPSLKRGDSPTYTPRGFRVWSSCFPVATNVSTPQADTECPSANTRYSSLRYKKQEKFAPLSTPSKNFRFSAMQ